MNSPHYKVAIRTDGSTVIGLGHVSTCLALAESLKQYPNISFYFIMKSFKEAVEKVRSLGYTVAEIPATLSEEEIIGKMLTILSENKTDLLVTDLLEIPVDFSQPLGEFGIKSVSIDILGKIKLQSDIVINRTFIKGRYDHYNRNGKTQYFLGPQYVVLEKQFFDLEKLQRRLNAEVRNVLVCLGGGDEFNITTRVVQILDTIPGIQGTIILGAAFKSEKELEQVIKRAANRFTIHRDVKNMADFLLSADLAICAGGSLLYGLAITGTPALIVPMNDHQVENANGFQDAGSVVNAGLHTSITDEEIRQNVLTLMNNEDLRAAMSIAGKKITDGRGAERIAKIIYNHLTT